MSDSRIERGTVITTITEPSARALGTFEVHEVRRRRSLPRELVARSRVATPRTRKTAMARMRPTVELRVLGTHDFGDGRLAIEFEGPSLDLMLYHDRGVTLAEWVTVDGELVTMIAVGVC
jgi:hypothetical protein